MALKDKKIDQEIHKSRPAAIRRSVRPRKTEQMDARKKNSDSLVWVWEFSKKQVLICSALYVFSFFYSCVVMWKFFDFTYLGTFIEQASDILKTCVFGYFIKAGVENVIKISGSKSARQNERETDADALAAPDGEESEEK